MVVCKENKKEAKPTTLDTLKEEAISKPIFQNLIFLAGWQKQKNEKTKQEILEILTKVEVNIPLLDSVKHVLRYAKFLKELCTD